MLHGNLKIGLIGCGRIAQYVHLRVLSRLPGARVVALAEADEARLADAAAMVPAAQAFRDYHDLLKSDAIDAVVICLPTGMHAEAAVAAFAAGKHVYLEKPIATNRADAQGVINAWRASGRVGQIGFNYRYHPTYEDARRRVASGEIGRVVAVRSTFCAAARDLPRWKRARMSGGGAMLDLASHHADILRYILAAEVHDVWASIRSVRSEADTASLEMRFNDGVLAQTLVSISAVEDDLMEIVGDKGKLLINRREGRIEFVAPKRGGAFLQRAQQIAALACQTMARSFKLLSPPFDPSYERALRHFVDCSATGATPRATFDDALRSLAVMLAAEESAASQRKVTVEGAPQLVESTVAPPPEYDMNAIASQLDDESKPAMSVVLVTTDSALILRPVVRHLRRQTVRSRIELILVGPSDDAFSHFASHDTDGFFAVKRVSIGPISNVDLACAPGIMAADAPIVALLEDHAFVEPDWAEVIIDAHRSGPWTAVGSTITNANPATICAWANHLLSYGEWNEPARGGGTTSVSRHNVTFKRDALVEYGDQLGSRLVRDGAIFSDLIARGHEFLLEPRARIHHVNPSRLSSTLQLRIGSGRLYAAARAKREKWGFVKRLIYTLGAPAIPAVRFLRLRHDLFIKGRKIVPQPKATAALVLGVLLDGIGQMIGYAFGPGRAGDKLAAFEWERARHLVPGDLPCLQGIADDLWRGRLAHAVMPSPSDVGETPTPRKCDAARC